MTNMKYITILFLFISILASGQGVKFQTYSADLLIIAHKDGQDIQWQNKDILASLDYKNGNIKILIKNTDFINKDTQEKIVDEDDIVEYTFKGTLPIEEILDQKPSNKEYTVELQLVNDDIDFSKVVNFKMNVMRTSQQSGSYRVFTFSGILYNDELQFPAFKGYDNEVEIRLMFNAFWNG